MDDDPIISSSSMTLLDAACSIGASVVLLVVTAATLRCVFRVVWTCGAVALHECRRWRVIATALAIVSHAFATDMQLEPVLPIVLAIAAVDCWLVTRVWPRGRLPRAAACRRTRPMHWMGRQEVMR